MTNGIGYHTNDDDWNIVDDITPMPKSKSKKYLIEYQKNNSQLTFIDAGL